MEHTPAPDTPVEDRDRPPPLDIVVWGPLAIYCRPEAKAERVSYPLPTPSAMRGTLEAIFWKPEFRYRVREIQVLRPIRYASLLRNEVSARANARSPQPFDVAENRTQRHTLALLNVAYRVRTDIEVLPGASGNEAAYRDQFRRRVARGRCFHRPYAGCRECALDFAAPDAPDLPTTIAEALAAGPIPETRDLGMMLFDIAFLEGGRGANAPLFFPATLQDGILRVPDEHYRALDALAGGPPRPRPPRPAPTEGTGEEDDT